MTAGLLQCKRTYSSSKLRPLMHHTACFRVCASVTVALSGLIFFIYFLLFSPRLVLFIFLFSSACALTGLASISPYWAFGPWQWKLERLEEVEDAPADDDVVIETHEAANLLGEKQNKTGCRQWLYPEFKGCPDLIGNQQKQETTRRANA